MCETSEQSIALVVLDLQLGGNLHAAVADEVVNHLQLVKECLLVEGLATEIEPYLVQNFLVLCSCSVGQLEFFVVFLSAGHDFNKNAKGSQGRKDSGVQGRATSNS